MTHADRRTTLGQIFPTLSLVITLFVLLGPGAARAEAQAPVYVANSRADVVRAHDLVNRNFVDIPVGSAPAQVVVDKDGRRAYVINAVSHSASVIDIASASLVATIEVGDVPTSVAVTPGGRVYVMLASGVLRAFNRNAGGDAYEAAGEVVIGGTNGRIAVTPDGGFVYVASGTVSVVRTSDHAVIHTFVPEVTASPNVTNMAVDVAISAAGTAYVGVITYGYGFLGFEASGGLAVVDTLETPGLVTETIPLYSLPGAISLSADGSRAFVGIQAYWANTGYGAAFLPGRWVTSIDTRTKTVDWIDLGGDASAWGRQNTAAGVAVSADGTALYVAIPGIDSLAVVSTASNTVTEYLEEPGGPSGVAVVPDGSASRAPAPVDPIAAVDDSPARPLPPRVPGLVLNVLANDTVGSAPAAGRVTLSLVSPLSEGVTLDTGTGAVAITAEAPVGSHSFTYEICDTRSPDNCGRAAVTLAVRAPFVIDAADDRVTSSPGTTAIANVLANDTLDSAAAAPNVELSVVSRSPGLGITNGWLFLSGDAAPGSHALVYRICEIASPANCDEATATVSVAARVIHAVNDSATASRTGGIAIASVLANDTLDEAPATLARVFVARVSSPNSGVTLDASTGSVTVTRGAAAGVHTRDYQICESASPSNCTEGTVTVTVQPYVVNAVPDQARASSKNSGIAISNVLANDTVGDSPATTSNVKLSLVSISPANSRIRLNSNGSVELQSRAGSGTYALVYQICEVAGPANCGRATVSLNLSGRD